MQMKCIHNNHKDIPGFGSDKFYFLYCVYLENMNHTKIVRNNSSSTLSHSGPVLEDSLCHRVKIKGLFVGHVSGIQEVD